MRENMLIGDRAFYRRTVAIALPIVLQNAVTNLVSLLDNMMIGQLGTESMSGAAIVNQLLLIFNLAVFGAMSGIGIFGAQYFGCGDERGVRYTFRFKLMAALTVSLVGILVFLLFDDPLIHLYLHEDGSGSDLALTLSEGRAYLMIMLLGLFPFALTQAYASTLREGGESLVPMLSGSFAILVNLCLNYVLIYGHLGAPALGIRGAAIATVISRLLECIAVAVYSHTHTRRWRFLVGAYRSLGVPRRLVGDILRRGTPLLFNEILWSLGIAVIARCYSTRGLAAVAATNIASTLTNLTSVVCFGIGSSVAIIVGQHLGAGRLREAKRDAWRLMALAIAFSVAFGILTALLAPLFPLLYETETAVRETAAGLIAVAGCYLPISCFTFVSYFIIRSGGKTVLTAIFDSAFLYLASLPVAFLLSSFTSLPLVGVYALVLACDGAKAVVGFLLVRSGIWLSNLTEGNRT